MYVFRRIEQSLRAAWPVSGDEKIGRAINSHHPHSSAVRLDIGKSQDGVRCRIEIVATGAASVGLLLNDDLVDLDRAVEVVVNGTTNRVSAYREWVTAIDRMVDGTSDPGRVYVAEARVPGKAAK